MEVINKLVILIYNGCAAFSFSCAVKLNVGAAEMLRVSENESSVPRQNYTFWWLNQKCYNSILKMPSLSEPCSVAGAS